MYAQKEKPAENKSRAVANSVAQKKSNVKQGVGFVDNRSEAIQMQKRQNDINISSQGAQFNIIRDKHALPISDEVGYAEVFPIQLTRDEKGTENVAQLIGFRRPKQPLQVMQWIDNNGLNQVPLFQGMIQRYNQDNTLNDDDAEAIGMLFLTMVTVYREFPYRHLALHFIFNNAYGYSIPRTISTISEFTQAYKTFYHLFMRSINMGLNEQDAIQRVFAGMSNIDMALQDMDTGQPSFGVDETGNEDVHIAMIQNFAENNQLQFHSADSGIQHLIKHGTKFNRGRKIIGNEGPNVLRDLYRRYLLLANIAVKMAVGVRDGETLGNPVYRFTIGGDTAIVSFDETTSTAYLVTFIVNEEMAEVNDVV